MFICDTCWIRNTNMDNQNKTDVAVDEGAVGGIVSTELNQETEDKNFKCEPCLFDNTEVKATTFCTDCFEHLCRDCTRDHRRNKILRNHKLLEGAEIPKDLEAIKVLKRMMACPDHLDSDVTYKCEDHDKYICVTCLAEYHRKCNTVNGISKVASSATEDMYSAVKETLSQLHECTVTSKTASEENIKSLRSQHSEVQKEQQNVFDRIYKQLAQSKQKLEFETDTILTKELNNMERNVQKCKEAEKEEHEYQRLLDVTAKFGNAIEVNVIPDLISRKAKVLKETLETKYRKERANIKFDRSLDFKTFANIGQVSIVYSEQVNESALNAEHRLSSDEILEHENASNAVMKLNAKHISPPYRANKNTKENTEQLVHMDLSKEHCDRGTLNTEYNLNQHSFMKRNVKQNAGSYSARCPDDAYPCSIFAIVILPDDRLVLIDKENQKLKVFNENFSLDCTFCFREYPSNLYHVYDSTVAVSFADIKAVDKYSIGPSHVSKTGQFSTKFEILALGKFGDDKKIAILLHDENGTSDGAVFIQIRGTENGRILETFHLEKSIGVTFNFDDVDVNRMLCRGTNEIFVSEYLKFHCFDIDKPDCSYIQESWFYKSRKGRALKDISDICGDDEGNIYVCGSRSHNIHQISAHNFRENKIIISNIKKPLSLSVNSRRGYLVVACLEDDYMHVYRFN